MKLEFAPLDMDGSRHTSASGRSTGLGVPDRLHSTRCYGESARAGTDRDRELGQMPE